MWVLSGGADDGERVRETVAPVEGDADGGGTGVRFRGGEPVGEEDRVDGVVPLVEPEGLGEMVFVVLVGFIERAGP